MSCVCLLNSQLVDCVGRSWDLLEVGVLVKMCITEVGLEGYSLVLPAAMSCPTVKDSTPLGQ